MGRVLPDPTRSADVDLLPVSVGAAQTKIVEKESSWQQRQQAILEVGRETVSPQDINLFLRNTASLLADALGMEHNAWAETTPGRSSFQVKLNLSTSDGFTKQYYDHTVEATSEDSLLASSVKTGRPIEVADLTDNDFQTDTTLARYGIRGALAVPLSLSDCSFGVLAACSNEVRHFDDEERMFAETIGHLASTAIAHATARMTLATERHFIERALEAIGAIVLMLDSEGIILQINKKCEDTTGMSSHEFLGRRIWDVFPASEGIDLFPLIFRKLKEGNTPVMYEDNLKRTQRPVRRIAWSYVPLSSTDGMPDSVVAIGLDVTRRWEAERNVKRAKSAVKQVANDLLVAAKQTTKQKPDGDHDKKQRSADPSERRRHVRRLYPFKQIVAPIVSEELPPLHWFHEVDCYDIAVGGFSFFSDKPPDYKRLVVGLGTPSNRTYLVARVAHVTPDEHKGFSAYRVGCMYLGKATY